MAGFVEELLRVIIDVFDWLVEKKDKRVSSNPAGYLVESIRKDYRAPRGFLPKAVREQRARERDEQKKTSEEAAKRREAREQEQQEAERGPIEAYLSALTEQERQALEEEALRAATREEGRMLKGEGPLANSMKRVLVARHVKAILAGEKQIRRST